MIIPRCPSSSCPELEISRSQYQAIRQGAEDFLTKSAPRKVLLEAIERALKRNARDHQLQVRRVELQQHFDSLSRRQSEVLQEVVQGNPNKQIADKLGIHERTVKLHRAAVMTKPKVHSVTKLTTLYHECRPS